MSKVIALKFAKSILNSIFIAGFDLYRWHYSVVIGYRMPPLPPTQCKKVCITSISWPVLRLDLGLDNCNQWGNLAWLKRPSSNGLPSINLSNFAGGTNLYTQHMYSFCCCQGCSSCHAVRCCFFQNENLLQYSQSFGFNTLITKDDQNYFIILFM